MITVVLVTYGRRSKFLSKAVHSIKNNYLVNDIIVIDNGSQEDIKALLLKYENKIRVIRSDINIGSAGGFHLGIKKAHEEGKGDFIFLLDDDNVVQKNCFEILLNFYHKLGNNYKICLKAFKYNNLNDLTLSNHWEYIDYPNSFSNFHLINKIKMFFKKNSNAEIIKVRGVGYSGFMFHRCLLNKIGYPDKRFVLYGDDTEYTLRFIKNGCEIYLIKNAIIKDLEISWNNDCNIKGNMYLSPNSDFVKSYYALRNRVYVEKKYLVNNYFVYFFNLTLYFFWNLFETFMTNKFSLEIFKRIFMFYKAFYKGWTGNLGRDLNLKEE